MLKSRTYLLIIFHHHPAYGLPTAGIGVEFYDKMGEIFLVVCMTGEQ